MKKIIGILCVLLTSYSYASGVIKPSELKNFVNSACSEHTNKESCEKAIYKFMSYVQENDDYFMQCQKLKSSGMSINRDACQQSKELRDFIEANAN